MSRCFCAVIIGDEIMSGKRQDKHFAKIAEMLGQRGLQLSWVEYLGDDRERLAATFRRTMATSTPKNLTGASMLSPATDSPTMDW